MTKSYGLIYTCNLGWLDLGHMNPKSTRPHTGASALWKEINGGGPDVKYCSGTQREICNMSSMANRHPTVKFSNDTSTGFKVIYKQAMGARIFGTQLSTGITREYIVRHNLTLDEKKSVALAIFMEVSLEFEKYQEFFPKFVTESGYSQEDLVSNLIGFHIAVGTITKSQVIAMAKPVSRETALAIWDRNGSVGGNKNRGFKPLYSPDTSATTRTACMNECNGISPRPPDFLYSIKPAKKGALYMNNVLGTN